MKRSGLGVQGCEWLSAKPAVKTEKKTTRTRNSRKSRNSHNKEKQTKMHKTRISQRTRKESQKNKIREQNTSNKSRVKRHITRWLFKNGATNARGGNQQTLFLMGTVALYRVCSTGLR